MPEEAVAIIEASSETVEVLNEPLTLEDFDKGLMKEAEGLKPDSSAEELLEESPSKDMVEIKEEPVKKVSDETPQSETEEDKTEEDKTEEVPIEDQEFSDDPEFMRALRAANKSKRTELIKKDQENTVLSDRLAELEKKIQEDNSKVLPASEQLTPVKESADTVMRALLGVENGDIDRSNLSRINSHLNQLTFEDLAGIQAQINMGAYGDDTDQIRDIVNRHSTQIMVNSELAKKENTKKESWENDRSRCIKLVNSVVQDNPKLKKAYLEKTEELMKIIPSLKTSAKAPELVLRMLSLETQAKTAETKRVARLEEELNTLKKQYNLSDTPTASNGTNRSASGATRKQLSPEEQLALDLQRVAQAG